MVRCSNYDRSREGYRPCSCSSPVRSRARGVTNERKSGRVNSRYSVRRKFRVYSSAGNVNRVCLWSVAGLMSSRQGSGLYCRCTSHQAITRPSSRFIARRRSKRNTCRYSRRRSVRSNMYETPSIRPIVLSTRITGPRNGNYSRTVVRRGTSLKGNRRRLINHRDDDPSPSRRGNARARQDDFRSRLRNGKPSRFIRIRRIYPIRHVI